MLAVARGNLRLGACFTALTVAAGLAAMGQGGHTDVQHAAILIHRRAALVTASVWGLLAIWDLWSCRHGRAPRWFFVVAAWAAVVPLAGAGWLGGELVYRHAVGVQNAAAGVRQ